MASHQMRLLPAHSTPTAVNISERNEREMLGRGGGGEDPEHPRLVWLLQLPEGWHLLTQVCVCYTPSASPCAQEKCVHTFTKGHA